MQRKGVSEAGVRLASLSRLSPEAASHVCEGRLCSCLLLTHAAGAFPQVTLAFFLVWLSKLCLYVFILIMSFNFCKTYKRRPLVHI